MFGVRLSRYSSTSVILFLLCTVYLPQLLVALCYVEGGQGLSSVAGLWEELRVLWSLRGWAIQGRACPHLPLTLERL